MEEIRTGGCEAWEDRIEPYFERPYWVVDILPVQVPAHSPGQYFAVEEYYLQEPRLSALRRKYLELLLKLNCYFDVEIPEKRTPGRKYWRNWSCPAQCMLFLKKSILCAC